LDYELAKIVSRHHRPSEDEGLVVLAVDSSMYGSGWVVYQIQNSEKHPVLFGSCTYNETESRYSQPKAELYGVFRAPKELRHRIWGIYFRIEADAKFLLEMLHVPDLPNAPMTCWLMYIQLFDFDLVHVPAEKHKVPDGLSRRKPSPLDSDDEDAEAYLDSFIGSTHVLTCSSVISTLQCFPDTVTLDQLQDTTLVLDANFFSAFCQMQRRIINGSGISYSSPTIAGKHSYLATIPNNVQTSYFDVHPCNTVNERNKDATLARTLLNNTGDEIYTGHEFQIRHAWKETEVKCELGGEVFPFVITEFRRAYMTERTYDDSLDNEGNIVDDRRNYRQIIPTREAISCIGHIYGVKDDESEIAWEDLLIYLRDKVLPPECTDPSKLKSFMRRSTHFIYHDDRLWKMGGKGKVPRLVITDHARRQSLIAEAHNETGHQGRDATYQHLWDRFYWLNLYDDVAFFVISCIICQLRSARRLKTAFEPTWNSSILRRFDLDTVYMPDGHGGCKFLLQAMEPAIAWPEAHASRRNNGDVQSPVSRGGTP
jgi:hypothetical protein